MGCVFACFGGSCQHRKRRLLVNATQPEAQRNEVAEALELVRSTKQQVPEKHFTQSKEKVVEEALSCNAKKKVTFDLNVKIHEEELASEQVTEILGKNNESKESDNLDQKNEKKEGGDDLVKSRSNENNKGSESKEEMPKVPNYRYQNCATSEDDYDEDLDLDLEESEMNDDCEDLGSNEKMLFIQEESSESLFSLSIESRRQVFEFELGEKEVNSPMPKCSSGNQQLEDRSRCVHSVLNAVENLTQRKVVKARQTSPITLKDLDKENNNFCREPSFKLLTWSSKLNKKVAVDGEIAVDTSLSSWLVESEATPLSKSTTISDGNSPRNLEVLGALTVEEVTHLSASTSARKSRRSRRSEQPAVGTIGSYWSHTGEIIDSDSGSSSKGMPKTGSKNREDEILKWHSTPLQARFDSWTKF